MVLTGINLAKTTKILMNIVCSQTFTFNLVPGEHKHI